MGRLSLVVVAAALAALLAVANALPSAIAVLTKTRHCSGSCTGKFEFTPGADNNSTTVKITLSGFPPSTRLGVHVHQFGDLASVDATAAGGHFNPYGTNHSCSGEDRHVGDIGNVDTDASGTAVATLTGLPTMLDINEYSYILGRMVVVHERADDCTSQPAGNAGNRLAQGVIGLADDTEDPIRSSGYTVSDLTHGHALLNEVDDSGVFAEVTIDPTTSTSARYNLRAVGLQYNQLYYVMMMRYGDLESPDYTEFYNPSSATGCGYQDGYLYPFYGGVDGVTVSSYTDSSGPTLRRITDSLLGRGIAIVHYTNCSVLAHGVVGIRGSAAWSKPTPRATLRPVPSSDLPSSIYAELTAERVFIKGRPSALLYLYLEGYDFPYYLNASVHIREFGDLTNIDGTSFGRIFNPQGVQHGCNLGGQQGGEAGALGNVPIDNTTYFASYFYSPLASLDSIEPGFIIGRGVVLVANTDTCAPGFNPGTPLLTGIIGYPNGSPKSQGVENPPAADRNAVQATCIFEPTGTNVVRGSVQLVPQGDGVDVIITANNLTPNARHAVYVHEFGDDRSSNAGNMGGHFNPFDYSHGCAPSSLRHAGDLGNIQADKNGRVYAKINSKLITLSASGVTSILGRGMTIRSAADDCTGSNGGSGSAIAQCIIGYSTVRGVVPPTGEPMPSPTSTPSAASSLSVSLTALAVVAAGFFAARA